MVFLLGLLSYNLFWLQQTVKYLLSLLHLLVVQPVLTNEALGNESWQYNHSIKVGGNNTSRPVQ